MVDRKRRAAARMNADDGGFTIIEVMVAMMIFAIIFLGVAYSTVTAMRMTADTEAREVAANLAAAEVDAVRAIGDPFRVQTTSYIRTIDGTQYTVRRKTGWVSASGTTEGCGSGTGTLQYKRVNVAVSWAGRLSADGAVARADTMLAPSTRLNDPSTGSILISVQGADGLGEPGVSVTVTPNGGGATPLVAQPAVTDTDGCSYAFLASPGSYKVAISRSGYIDTAQAAAPVAAVAVAAGGAASATFQYDAAATYAISYGDPGPAAVLPDGLATTFFSAYGDFTREGALGTVSLHPFASGYTAVVGKYVPASETAPGCVSPDPAAWPAQTVNDRALTQGVRGTAAAAPGSTETLRIPMGRIEVEAGGAQMRIVSAVSTVPSGDPGCGIAATHTYSSLPATGTVSLAAPFGSWRLEERVDGAWTTVPADRYSVPTNAAGDIVGDDVVTVDPRGPAE